MFSKNEKISEKQLRRMVILPVFASVILVVPFLSARLFKESVFLGLLVFFALASLYVLWICGVGEWFAGKLRETEGILDVLAGSGLVGKTLILVQLARIVVRLAFYILLTIGILEEAQVPFMLKAKDEVVSNLLVVLPFLLVCVYGAHTKVEKQGRIHEMLFWLFFVPFLVMLLFGLREMDYSIFVPRATISFGKIMLYAYMLLTFLLPMEYYLYLRPYVCRNKEKKSAGFLVVWTLLLAVFIILVMLGIYGLRGAGEDSMVTVNIMRYIRLPFGILERFDILMIWFFMIGCFILICGSLYFAGYLFSKLREHPISKWVRIGILVLALAIVLGVRTYENGLLTFLCYSAVLDIPISICIPLIGMGVCKYE